MTMGERITALRKGRGMTQEALAEKLGVTRQSVSKWELDQATPEVGFAVALPLTVALRKYKWACMAVAVGVLLLTAAATATLPHILW